MNSQAHHHLAQLLQLGSEGQWAYDRILQLTIENAQLRQTLEQKQAALEQTQSALQQAHQQIEQLQREAHRQAAPFRRPEHKRDSHRGRPGRKGGHRGTYRPIPKKIDQELHVPLDRCPCCQGPVIDKQPLVQYIEDIPPVQPHVTKLPTEEGWCPQCQKDVYSTHPLQVSRAQGAAQVHLGPRALAIAADLKAKGLSMRKIVAVLEGCFGLKLTAGALAMALQRIARRMAPEYERLPELLRKSPVVHADETSWWRDGPGWWLWVFTTPQITYYVIAQSRGSAVALQVLGDQFEGTLVSDCLAVYDDLNPLQQKCYSHHLKAVSEACLLHPQHGEDYLHQIQALLRTALVLKALQPQAESAAFQRCVEGLKRRAHTLLETPRAQAQEEKVRSRLYKQRDHLFTFLERPEVPATNNLAERQLRPAVIARKISCGNKTDQGATAWACLISIAATCIQTGRSFIDAVALAVLLHPSDAPCQPR